MNTQPDSDLYEDDIPDASELLDFELIAKSQPDKGQGLWLWVVLVLILAGGGFAGWLFLQGDGEEVANTGGVPLILAPKINLKEKPTDPGGMNVPDRDKLVYDRMAGDPGQLGDGVERLLPPPETPLEPPESLNAPAAAVVEPAPPIVPAPQALVPKALKPVPVEPAVVAPTPPPPPAPVVAPTPAPAPVVAPAPKVQVAPKVAAAPKAKGTAGQGYMVQLSAVRTEQAAKSEWSRLAKKHPDILGGLDSVILRADLGTKGIFYRVRGGWFKTRAEAKAVCTKLARRNVGCIIAKP